jgi:disulfide bond formation protein DsbB
MTDTNEPIATNTGLASTEVPAAEPVRGPAPAEAAQATQSSIVALALEWWPVLAFVASAAMLAVAHAFETFGKLAPCHLCLKQREVYWVAGTVALIAIVAKRTPWAAKVRRPFDLLLAAIFLYGAGLAAFHAGVEWKWWPGPTTCTGGGVATAGDLVAMLKGGSVKVPQCDKAAWVFLGLSMAGWNALASLGLSVASLTAGLRKAPQ